MPELRSELSNEDPYTIYIYNVKILSIYCLVFTISYFFYNISWIIVEGKTPTKKILSLIGILIFLTIITLLMTSFIGVKMLGI